MSKRPSLGDRHPFTANRSAPWRIHLFEIIFLSDTRAGKRFDLLLIAAIAISVGVVMFDSVHAVHARWAQAFHLAEWAFTALFTVEYVLRLLCVDRPLRYAVSFFGLVDLLAILPSYFAFFLPGSSHLIIIRILRILRVFRILKLGAYLGEADILLLSLQASRKKIEVFLLGVLTLVILFGSLMYLLEGEANGFTSIPRSIYWAIVTLTTVGYGDIAPKTPPGQLLASIIMICGYAIIAVPTGIVSAEMHTVKRRMDTRRICRQCGDRFHDAHAKFCKSCGEKLPQEETTPPRDQGVRK